MMQATIRFYDKNVAHTFLINKFFYDATDGVDYVILDTTNEGSKKYRVDSIEEFRVSKFQPI